MSAFARWLAVGALVGASIAHAQGNAIQDRIEISPPADWEGGWAIASKLDDQGFSTVEFRPATQTADSGRYAVVLMEIWGGSQRDGSARLLRAWENDLRKTCPNASAPRGATRNATGFSVQYMQYLCPKRTTGEGSVHFVKTISSDKRTYLVGVLRAGPPFTVAGTTVRYDDPEEAAALNRWIKSTSAYLENVRACDRHSEFVSVCSP